jgi:hypothetical protein
MQRKTQSEVVLCTCDMGRCCGLDGDKLCLPGRAKAAARGLVYFLGFLCVDCIHVCMYLLRCICDKTLSSDSKRGTGVPSALGPYVNIIVVHDDGLPQHFYMAYQIQRDLKFSGQIHNLRLQTAYRDSHVDGEIAEVRRVRMRVVNLSGACMSLLYDSMPFELPESALSPFSLHILVNSPIYLPKQQKLGRRGHFSLQTIPRRPRRPVLYVHESRILVESLVLASTVFSRNHPTLLYMTLGTPR